MELNWSTFLFEVINFVVLVWILKRFLYKPVQQVMARRKAEIDQKLSAANLLQAENEQLNQQYLNRLDEWEKERQQKRQQLQKELEIERANKLKELQQQLQQQQDKAQLNEQQRQDDLLRQLEGTALKSAATFATQLLRQGAGAETETRLIEMAIADFLQLTEQQKAQLVGHYGEPPSLITVQSAYPLTDNIRVPLEQAILSALEHTSSFEYAVNKELIAGTRIIIGNWIVGLNMLDELRGFMELSHEH